MNIKILLIITLFVSDRIEKYFILRIQNKETSFWDQSENHPIYKWIKWDFSVCIQLACNFYLGDKLCLIKKNI